MPDLKILTLFTDKEYMKTFIILSLLVCLNALAEDSKKEEKKESMDDGDKQLLNRDVCRKPIEYLETRYSQFKKEELEKMKAKCKY